MLDGTVDGSGLTDAARDRAQFPDADSIVAERAAAGGAGRAHALIFALARDSRRFMVSSETGVFRDEWGRVLASLVGFLGDFEVLAVIYLSHPPWASARR